MKCQILFSVKNKEKKIYFKLLTAVIFDRAISISIN